MHGDATMPSSQLAIAMQLYGLELLQGEIPVIDAVIAAVDGERDPRCLLLAFDCIRLTAVQHSNAGPEASQVSRPSSAQTCPAC